MWLIGGKPHSVWLPDTDDAYYEVMKETDYHLRRTDRTRDIRGVMKRMWVLLKPSHEMTTKEMTVLVDAAVEEARNLDIETLTPYQLKELREREQRKAGD